MFMTQSAGVAIWCLTSSSYHFFVKAPGGMVKTSTGINGVNWHDTVSVEINSKL